MQRLSTLDAEFLHLEDGIAHMHIAGVSVFEGPAPQLQELHTLLRAKLHLIPRYRQRVRSVPLELGRPVWVDDPHFNLDYHVRHTALPPPGTDADLCRLVGRLMSQPLDRNRPLWEAWMVENLPDDRWAIVSKVHHCMVDGISGVDLLTILLDLDPDAEPPDPEPWEPEPEPSGVAKVLDAWRGLAADLGDMAGRVPRVVTDPAASWTRSGTRGPASSSSAATSEPHRSCRSRARSDPTACGRTHPPSSRTSRQSRGRTMQPSTTSCSAQWPAAYASCC